MSFPEPITVVKSAAFLKALNKHVDKQYHLHIEEYANKLITPNTHNCDIEFVRCGQLNEKTYRYKFGRWRIFFLISEDSKTFTLIGVTMRDGNTY